jgi:hypothetical protein
MLSEFCSFHQSVFVNIFFYFVEFLERKDYLNF